MKYDKIVLPENEIAMNILLYNGKNYNVLKSDVDKMMEEAYVTKDLGGNVGTFEPKRNLIVFPNYGGGKDIICSTDDLCRITSVTLGQQKDNEYYRENGKKDRDDHYRGWLDKD